MLPKTLFETFSVREMKYVISRKLTFKNLIKPQFHTAKRDYVNVIIRGNNLASKTYTWHIIYSNSHTVLVLHFGFASNLALSR